VTVLILAPELDISADRMVTELGARGVPVFRVDTAWFPASMTVDACLVDGHWAGTLATRHRTVELSDVRSVFYRTPTVFGFPRELSPAERGHAFLEAKFGLGGVLASLDVLWVNHPNRAAAAYKPVQLALAARCGLAVPDTAITNSADAVTAFVGEHGAGRVITKMLGANHIEEAGARWMAFTRVVTMDDLVDLRGVGTTAHLLQCWIRKDHEVRVIAVGDRLFGVAIRAGSKEAFIDFRADYPALSYAQTDVPRSVRDGIIGVMNALGLAYGALDFVVTPTGRWVFLECNSGGQYDWLEARTGVPLTAALADLLAGPCS
jgi:ATP-grasp ribosomal peptide maturase